MNIVAWVFTALAAAVAMIVILAGGFGFLSDFYFLLLEILYWYAAANTTILIIAAVVVALLIVLRLLDQRLIQLAPPVGTVARRVVWGLFGLFGIVAQLYVIAFAFFAQRLYFLTLLIIAYAAWFAVKKWRPPTDDRPTPSFFGVLLFIVVYLFIGMVSGHVATPLVHNVSAFFARLSRFSPMLFRLSAALCLLLPLLASFAARIRYRKVLLIGAAVVIAMAVAIPATFAIYLVAFVSLIVVLLSVTPPDAPLPLSPDSQASFQRLLLMAMIALNAMTVHYFAVMWNCTQTPDQSSVMQLSTDAGAFDLATDAAGDRLLAGLREPQQVIAVHRLTGRVDALIDTNVYGEGTGRPMSRVEPENLLRVGDSDRFLLLTAVSDDEQQNRVAIIDGAGNHLGFVQDLPQTSIADMVADGQGHIYLSTEFQDLIFVLDETTLAVIDRIEWPGAETNKILIAPDINRIFSLGLWWDGHLRALDLTTRREVGALEVGTRSWDMAYDAQTQRLFIPRFLSGTVLVVDAQTLTEVDRWPAGFGARAVEIDPDRRLLYIGTMYSGEVVVFDIDQGREVMRRRLGGYIKGMHIDRRSHLAYTGCNCGLFAFTPPN